MTDNAPNCPPPADWNWTEGTWLFTTHDDSRVHIWAQTRDGEPRVIAGYPPHRVLGLVLGLATAVEELDSHQGRLIKQLLREIEDELD